MQSDEEFYDTFREWVLGKESIIAEEKKEAKNAEDYGNEERNAAEVSKSARVSFLIHQLEIVPDLTRKFYDNLMRAYPTSPLFLLLGIGTLGTNIARYSAIRRLEGHLTSVVRTGCFYKFLAPSRFGKGIVMGLITKLGTHVEKLRQQSRKTTILSKD